RSVRISRRPGPASRRPRHARRVLPGSRGRDPSEPHGRARGHSRNRTILRILLACVLAVAMTPARRAPPATAIETLHPTGALPAALVQAIESPPAELGQYC